MAHLKNFERFDEGEKIVYRKQPLSFFIGFFITMAESIASTFRE